MFFKPRKNEELERLLASVSANASNNYKDAAQESFRSFKEALARLEAEGKLNEKQRTMYEEARAGWERELEGFTHKDQGHGL